MPNPNAIVDTIVRVEPPLDKPPADVLRESERGLTFEFADGRRARLDRSNERAPALAGILEELRRRGILGGVQRDAGFDGSGMTQHRLAILPGVTRYEINVPPMLASAVIAFLDEL